MTGQRQPDPLNALAIIVVLAIGVLVVLRLLGLI